MRYTRYRKHVKISPMMSTMLHLIAICFYYASLLSTIVDASSTSSRNLRLVDSCYHNFTKCWNVTCVCNDNNPCDLTTCYTGCISNYDKCRKATYENSEHESTMGAVVGIVLGLLLCAVTVAVVNSKRSRKAENPSWEG